MDTPVFSLSAVRRHELASVTRVFNISDFEYYLWVKVPNYARTLYSIYQLDEINSEKKEYDLAAICEHEPGRFWYRINSNFLNQSPGHHVYKMSMVNKDNDSTIGLYFAYIVQNDLPEKPYVYMKEHDDKRVKRYEDIFEF